MVRPRPLAVIAAALAILVLTPVLAGYLKGRPAPGPGAVAGSPAAGPTATGSTTARSGAVGRPAPVPPGAGRVREELGTVTIRPVAGPHGAVRSTSAPAVALTFDDGPSPQWTPKVLALLARYGVHATFCLIGTNVVHHPDLVRAIVAGGHTLCNHTWNHDINLGRRGPAAIRADLTRTSRAIEAAAPGAPVRYFRQPGGVWTDSEVEVARELGMASLHWSVDPRDWSRPPTATIEAVVAGGCQPGNIVLLHDGGGDRSHTYAALGVLLPRLVRTRTFMAMPTSGL